MHLRSLPGTVAGAQKQAVKLNARAIYADTALRGSSSPTSERMHQQRSRERAKLQLCPAAALHACICYRFQASLLGHKSKPLKCARHVHAKHRAVCAASAVTHPNDCTSNAAASEQSCSSARQPRCMRAFEIAFSLHIGTQTQAFKMCAANTRGHRYHLRGSKQ